jgi:hypothetical protein
MIYTKPCERPGCDGLAKGRSLNQLAKRHFCSTRCCYRYRRDMGIPIAPQTPEQRREAGRKGGLVGSARRFRQASQAYAEDVKTKIPESLLGKLTFREQSLLTVLMVRTWEQGHRVGMSCERQRSYAEQARKRQAA